MNTRSNNISREKLPGLALPIIKVLLLSFAIKMHPSFNNFDVPELIELNICICNSDLLKLFKPD